MERVTGVGGVFFRGRDPSSLLDWYRNNLGVDPEPDGGAVVFRWARADSPQAGRSTTWSIFSADTDYFGPSGQSFMINYRVDDLDGMLAQLRAAGAEVDERVEDSEFGRFGWAVDPEGNRLELWQPAEGL